MRELLLARQLLRKDSKNRALHCELLNRLSRVVFGRYAFVLDIVAQRDKFKISINRGLKKSVLL